jgi:hypothetical protein
MNERIKELIKQADYNAPGGQWKEYFAELIVKECADVATYHFRRFEDGGKAIKEHFGVEE